jgi:hypothetical protein
MRADMATLGAELWLGDAWLLSGTGYLSDASGVVIPDPRPGVTLGRPLFTAVEQRGRGIELAARRVAGRLTGSLAYTLAHTEQRLGELVFPSRADRPFVLDATALFRASTALRVGAAYTLAGGAPFTRVVHLEVDASGHEVGVLAEPNAARAPSYGSMDLMVEWTRSFPSWRLGLYLQLRNALGRANRANYVSTTLYCSSGVPVESGSRCPDGADPTPRDEFLVGMPRLPLLGLRLEF